MANLKVFSNIAFFLIMLFGASVQANIDRNTVVHIITECRHPVTGAIETPIGSGVIIHEEGYILTAAHVVQCEINDVGHDRLSVKIRQGIHRGEPQLDSDVRGIAEEEDIAVLKIVSPGKKFSFNTACRMAPLVAGLEFIGYGFPEGREYAAVNGSVGGETADGNYSVTAPFAGGMSGGPIIIDDYVVALIHGGAKDVVAHRRITPLFRAGSVIQNTIGHRFPFCSDIGEYSVLVRVNVEESSETSRVKNSARFGVSTGSLVEEKCQRFVAPATQGWTINPDSVRVVGRVSQGSSRASIVEINQSRVIVEFCAKSRMDGFSKKTGDSFGAVRFSEAKVETTQVQKLFEANSNEGEIKLSLPENAVSWTGELLEVGADEAVSFMNEGRFGDFQIESLEGHSGIIIQRFEH